MLTQFSRTELLLGKEAMDRLKNARVAVFGIGGVGGYVCEALVRTGVGYFDLIDDDKVCLTNLNRQIIATRKTVGKYKTEVMKERMLEINPDVKVEIHDCFFLPENAKDFPFEEYDYIVDAVDTVTAKIALVMKAKEMNIPIISSMGAGNKLDASKFEVADIYKTSVCPLAKVMRRELKKRCLYFCSCCRLFCLCRCNNCSKLLCCLNFCCANTYRCEHQHQCQHKSYNSSGSICFHNSFPFYLYITQLL